MQPDSTFPGSELDMSNMTAESDKSKTEKFSQLRLYPKTHLLSLPLNLETLGKIMSDCLMSDVMYDV